jgi:fructokinase
MIIACGEALIDMVPGTIPGEKGDREIYEPCFGGSPYNTAIAAGRILGTENGSPRTAFLSRLSRDFFGEMLVDNLERNHVSTAISVRSEENTPLAFVKLEAGKEPAYIFYSAETASASLVPPDIPPELPAGTDCLIFGSISLTMEPSAGTIENFIARESSRENGPVISHDPNVRPMMIRDREAYVRRFESWVRSSVIVKISLADFDFIYPGAGLEKSMERILSMGSCLNGNRGPRLLAVTLGKDGALALLRTGADTVIRVSAPVVDLPVADTIGAGDTFHGAFLAWLEMKGFMSRNVLAGITEGKLREALFFANKAASIVCSRKGADPPTLKEIEELRV